jgi:FlaA1/EpsC-like NDP-sugar epimerase
MPVEYDWRLPVTGQLTLVFCHVSCANLPRAYIRRPPLTANMYQISPEGAEPYLIYGTGNAGFEAVEALRAEPSTSINAVAMLGENVPRFGASDIQIPVVGPISQLPVAVTRFAAKGLLIALPSATQESIRPVVEKANGMGLDVKVVAPIVSVLAEPVNIRDILNTDEGGFLRPRDVFIDHDAASAYITGRRVLITGAGGSLGAEMALQISRFRPSKLFLFDHDESLLQATQLLLARQREGSNIHLILADIRDDAEVRRLFEEHRPEVVVHTAALKHVPLLQENPGEAIKTNVLGVLSLLRSSWESEVQTFINVSTDKASEPDSAYAYSKRAAERLTAHFGLQGGGSYFSIRFGNILGSRGSVVPIFQEQIRLGGPITVTDPSATRCFLSAGEASQLLIQAGAQRVDEAVLTATMGSRIRIDDLARAMIRHSGKPISIQYAGLRKGEKAIERLGNGDEVYKGNPSAQLAPAQVRSLRPSDILYSQGMATADIHTLLRYFAVA